MLVFFSNLFLSCFKYVKDTDLRYKLVQTYKFPAKNENNLVYQYEDSSTIFLINGFRIFKIPFGESLVEYDVLKYDTIKWHYVGHKEYDFKCLYFKDLSDSKVSLINIDSFYKTRPNGKFLDSTLLDAVKKNPINQLKFQKTQFYSYELEGFESVKLFFDKSFTKFSYSLSPTIDSVFNSKLVNIKLMVNKNQFPDGSPDSARVIEIRLQKLDFTINDSKVFYIKNRLDSFYSSNNLQN